MQAPHGLRALWDKLLDAAISNPVGFFFLFRWLTWLLALLIVYTGSVPNMSLRLQSGLLLYAAFQLTLGTLYALVLHPRLTRTSRDLTGLKPPYDLVAVGAGDMVGSLALIYYSDGWASPFWHYAVTSLLVPCFLLAPVWGMATVVGYTGAYVLMIAATGSGLEGALQVGQRNFFIGNLVTAFLVAIAVSYLGTLFRTLQAQRLRTRQALDETETLFQVTQSVVQGGTDLEALVGRVTQVVRTSGLFGPYAVFLQNEDQGLDLISSTVGVEELERALAHRAVKERRTIASTKRPENAWQAAVPMLTGEEVMGVMMAGANGRQGSPEGSVHLAEAVASQLAIGVRNAILARQKTELVAQEERGRIAREIHDGIAQSIYMLSLHLETCADLAQEHRHDLKERLNRMVTLSKETLLEVRHYIFDLKPYLAGEKGLVSMVENQLREFNKVAGVPATLETQGEERQAPVPVATCLYRVTQEALANTFKHTHASQVSVVLEFLPVGVQLTVRDDGQGFDPASADQGYGLHNMRQRAEELGGTFSLNTAPSAGTEVVIRLPC